jgi:hypothetical protein
VHIAVVDHAAVRAYFHGALLLAFRAVEVFALAEKLQVSEPSERGSRPQDGQPRYDQEPDAWTLPIHCF